MKLKKKLSQKLLFIPLWSKILYLIVNAIIYFPFFITETNFHKYILFVLIYVLFNTFLASIICGKKTILIIILLWITGLLFYILSSVIFFLCDFAITPTMSLSTPLNKILYLSLYPIRMLGIFLNGFIFIQILSPVQFLKYGKFGLKIALVLRSVNFITDEFKKNRQALIMSGIIPDDEEIKKNKKNILLMLKQSPLLITLTIRNLFLWIYWIIQYFKKIEKKELK